MDYCLMLRIKNDFYQMSYYFENYVFEFKLKKLTIFIY